MFVGAEAAAMAVVLGLAPVPDAVVVVAPAVVVAADAVVVAADAVVAVAAPAVVTVEGRPPVAPSAIRSMRSALGWSSLSSSPTTSSSSLDSMMVLSPSSTRRCSESSELLLLPSSSGRSNRNRETPSRLRCMYSCYYLVVRQTPPTVARLYQPSDVLGWPTRFGLSTVRRCTNDALAYAVKGHVFSVQRFYCK
jgi:hypothetical protein